MSAPLCGRCGFQVEDERSGYVLPRCFACLPPPEPLRVIPTRDQLEAEITRLRAALAEIAARHTPSPDDDTPASGPSESLHGAYGQGFDASTFVAAEMARKALVQP